MLTAAILMSSPITAFAQQNTAEQNTAEQNECLLASKNCMNQVDDIYQRMHKLEREIQKGQRVYSPEDLRRLQQKLTETQQLLDDLERPGK